jgi:hypothetical protein
MISVENDDDDNDDGSSVTARKNSNTGTIQKIQEKF